MKAFDSNDLIKCLICLGFKPKKRTGSSHHKYTSPIKVSSGQRNFIIVIEGRKYDPITLKKCYKQIQKLGFTEKEINKCLF